jgi:polyisoprenoid-binding protein YceI
MKMSWEIDASHSHAAFSVRHMMVSTVRGRFNVMRGHLHIDEQQPSNSWVDAEVDAASIDTHDEKRDAHLRSADFFEVDIYPTITFKSTRIEHLGGQEYKVTGDLTMHGVTRQVTFDAEYSGQSNMMGVQRAGLSAKTRINRKDFGLGWGAVVEAGAVAVSENVAIEIDLEAVQAPAAQEAGSTTRQ